MNVGSIPLEAYLGTATAYTFAAQWLGGPALGPEVPASFMIVFPCPDVAVVGLTAAPTDTYVGNSVKITVAVLNDHHLPQSFNVTIYGNSNVLQTLTIVNLDPYAEENFTYIWDTYTFFEGDYIIKAYAWPVPGETDTADNTYVDGTVHITQRVSPTHDVAITRYEQSKDVVGVGYSCSITITVQNQGDYTETFNVTAYANTTAIETQTVNSMPNGTSTILTFTWNTTGFAKGNYAISAYAWPVQGETDTADNTLADGWAYVSIPGDLNADAKVNILDAILLAGAFGSFPGHPSWKPNADISGDGRVNILDAIILSGHFGEADP
jgi:hypothetical protein